MSQSQAPDELIDAIKRGDIERVKAMVTESPRLVDARGVDGQSVILTAVYHRQKAVIDLLVARGATLTLAEASAAGEFDRVVRLLAGSPEAVNEYGTDGWTPLHLAAFFGHSQVAELLLAHGADVAAVSRNANANTPLHAALAANRQLIAGLLAGAGADVNARDGGGNRPLHIAAANNSFDAMATLIAQGADVAATNGSGLTALAIATERNNREAAALLQRHSR